MGRLAAAERGAAALKSMTQTWNLLRAGRSNFWAAIFMAMTGTREASDVSAMVWTLRTWPLELITWPMTNSHRLDIVRTGIRDRFGKQNSATRVLPANERGQGRWNGAPRCVPSFATPGAEMTSACVMSWDSPHDLPLARRSWPSTKPVSSAVWICALLNGEEADHGYTRLIGAPRRFELRPRRDRRGSRRCGRGR